MNAMVISRTHTTYTSDMRQSSTSTQPSIRQIMLSGIAFDAPKARIEEQVNSLYSESMGAQKFSKHLNWYKSRVNKVGTAEHLAVLKLWDSAFATEASETVPAESNVA